jgi:two-component system, OmpR family, alkaline phosphatase synthesis response regulator PhoP
MNTNGKILICDDEPHIRRLIEQSLEEMEDEGVEIITTADGEEALAAIRAEAPDLIILDVMMPKMNGFDLCETIKSDKALRSSYVMLLTAKGQEHDRHHGQEIGADRYMTKPFDPDELLSIAREVLLSRG